MNIFGRKSVKEINSNDITSIFKLISILLLLCGFCHANCLEKISAKYSISEKLLWSIAIVESGVNPLAIGPINTNGTTDFGLMQINSSWIPKLEEYGIHKEDLFKPCVSVEIAAWVLAQNISTYGNTWQAVGAYNSVKLSSQIKYVDKVAKIFRNIRLEDIRNKYLQIAEGLK